MIKIPYPSQNELDSYFDEIKAELLQRIRYVYSQKTISIDKKTFLVTNEIKTILSYLEDEKELKKALRVVEAAENAKKEGNWEVSEVEKNNKTNLILLEKIGQWMKEQEVNR